MAADPELVKGTGQLVKTVAFYAIPLIIIIGAIKIITLYIHIRLSKKRQPKKTMTSKINAIWHKAHRMPMRETH